MCVLPARLVLTTHPFITAKPPCSKEICNAILLRHVKVHPRWFKHGLVRDLIIAGHRLSVIYLIMLRIHYLGIVKCDSDLERALSEWLQIDEYVHVPTKKFGQGEPLELGQCYYLGQASCRLPVAFTIVSNRG